MKVLFLIDDLGPGGAQRQLLIISKNLNFIGYKITILSYSTNSFYKEELLTAGIDVCNLNEKRLLRRIIKVRRYIRTGGFETVISFLGPPNFLNIVAGLPYRRWKIILSERSANPAISHSLQSRVIRLFYLFADAVISNSHANIKLLRKINPLLPKTKCKVIYNAVDLEKFKPLQTFHYRSQDILKIVIPASYRRLKNILNLIEALNVLTDQEQNLLLVEWYGDKTIGLHRDGALNEALALIDKYHLHSVIRLFPLNHDILGTVQSADAIGLFSFFEGLPNAICEGMACGKPIIASSISDIPLFIDDGENGFLCDPHSINSIRKSLQNLLSCPVAKLEDMGKKNRLKAIELFSKDNNVGKYHDLIRYDAN